MPAEAIKRKKDYTKRKKLSLCPRCGKKNKKSSKFTYCDECREYFRNYNRELSEAIQEVRRERYAVRKDKQCCPRCGSFVGKKSKNIICSPCLDKQYKYNTGNTRPKKLKNK